MSPSEIQRWADKAMFEAEPMPEEARKGPVVHLLSMTADPLGAIAAACKMYKGEVVRSLADVTNRERHEYLEQVQKTKLKAPFEFVKFHFMIEGVTRSFTHQMVRQRTAVYAQESLRFAVKDHIDEEVALPPSLAALPADHPRRVLWRQAVNKTEDVYHALVADGVPAEDARGLLPHNITTRLHYATDLRALLDHAGNRLCTQAQFEWRLVFTRIVEAIRHYRPHAAMIRSMFPGGDIDENKEYLKFLDFNDQWQYDAIAEMFKPVCYLTGRCEFKANFDRSCSIRDRVDLNEKEGRGSENWSTNYDNGRVYIPAIHPAEWLADPGAAR
jgi:flavin-dependent thymidylate synthase